VVAPKAATLKKVEAPPKKAYPLPKDGFETLDAVSEEDLKAHQAGQDKPTSPTKVGKKDIQMKRVAPGKGAAAEVHGAPKKAYPLPKDGFETLDAVSEEDLKAHNAKAAPRTIEMHSFMQKSAVKKLKAPEDELAKEMTHDLEMNFNKIAPFGKEDTAKELQDHAAKTQDTLVDAVENAEVAEIKRAVFRALTRLRAAAIKEFDTIARLETQAIDAYNDAHHYRAENPLTHLHEDEAPVETDKLKSFH